MNDRIDERQNWGTTELRNDRIDERQNWWTTELRNDWIEVLLMTDKPQFRHWIHWMSEWMNDILGHKYKLCTRRLHWAGHNEWMNEWCFRPRFCTVQAILGRRHPGWMRWISGPGTITMTQYGQMRWILVWSMPDGWDRSLHQLTSISVHYHGATDPTLNTSPPIW